MDLHQMGTLMDDPDLHIRVRAACALHGVGMTDAVLTRVVQAAASDGEGGDISDQTILTAVAALVPPAPPEAEADGDKDPSRAPSEGTARP